MGLFGLNQERTSFAKVLLMAVVALTVMVIIPPALGLSKGGFSVRAVFDQFSFYGWPGLGAVLIILLLTGFEIMVKKNDIIYGNGLGFYSPGDKPHDLVKAKIFKNPIQLSLLALIILCILGLLTGVTQQTYFGIGTLQEQFTKFDNTVYNGSLVATSENLQAAAVMALIIFGWRFYARKKGMGSKNFVILSWVSAIIGVILFGIVNHLSRYGSSDFHLTNVAIVWGSDGIFTMLTGSFLVGWLTHIVNNVFYEIGQAFSSDGAVGILVGVIVLLSALYVWLYVIRPNKKKGGE